MQLEDIIFVYINRDLEVFIDSNPKLHIFDIDVSDEINFSLTDEAYDMFNSHQECIEVLNSLAEEMKHYNLIITLEMR